MLLTKGNKKLGKRIYTFSIPNISTCPGRSELCERLCYVNKYTRIYPSVERTYQDNYRLTLNSKRFIKLMQEEIATKKPETVRIHVSGDFYSNEYIQSWIEIVKNNPDVKFYAYTRSWAVSYLRFKLRELGMLPNFKLWLSRDKEMINIPASMAEFDVAYMTENEDEEQRKKLSPKVKLVFRNDRRTVAHRISSRIVCPLERGLKVNLTCSKCEICF